MEKCQVKTVPSGGCNVMKFFVNFMCITERVAQPIILPVPQSVVSRPNDTDKLQPESMYLPLQIYDLLEVDGLVKVVWRSKLAVSGEQSVTILSTT